MHLLHQSLIPLPAVDQLKNEFKKQYVGNQINH